MVETVELQLTRLLTRAPLGTAVGGVIFIAWSALLPPSNLPYVLSGVAVGTGMFAVLLLGFRFTPRWAWALVAIFIIVVQMLAAAAGQPEGISSTAEFWHPAFLAITTMFGLLSVFRKRIENRFGVQRAV